MAAGLNVWDSSGKLIFKSSDRITKFHKRTSIKITTNSNASYTLTTNLSTSNSMYVFLLNGGNLVSKYNSQGLEFTPYSINLTITKNSCRIDIKQEGVSMTTNDTLIFLIGEY